jgi:type I restriction enzyme, R subunit
LDDLIKQKQEESLAIEEILNQLGVLYSELDEVASLPQRMGFPDKGTFEIFTLIKNVSKAEFNEELSRDFSLNAFDSVIKRKIYIGWQDVPREYERLQTHIEILAANPKYEELKINDQEELIERIMKAILANYSLD